MSEGPSVFSKLASQSYTTLSMEEKDELADMNSEEPLEETMTLSEIKKEGGSIFKRIQTQVAIKRINNVF